jgi:AcrR family transcriptional regulator
LPFLINPVLEITQKLLFVINMEYVPKSSLKLRERGKARRYADVISAAAGLWRERRFEHVSLSQIAAAAEVSPQTIYNLVGGVDAVAFGVIKLVLDKLDAALSKSEASGIELALDAARISAELYVADAQLYRQLLVRIPRVLFEGTHLGRDVAQIEIAAVTTAQHQGNVASDIDPDKLGRAIYTGYLGALYDWACGDSGNLAFLDAAQIAVLMPLAACATETARADLTVRLFDLLRRNHRCAVGETVVK